MEEEIAYGRDTELTERLLLGLDQAKGVGQEVGSSHGTSIPRIAVRFRGILIC